MFGFLKKKLKEGIEKISKAVSEKEEKKIEEVVEEIKKEEHIEEPKKELIKEVEKEIEKPEITEVKPEEAKPETKEEVKTEMKSEEAKEEIAEKAVEIVEKVTEQRVEEAKEIVGTAKEIESVKEKPTEKAVESFEKKVEEKLTKVEEKKAKEVYEEFLKEQETAKEIKVEEKPKKKLLGFLKRKPKEEKIEKPKEEVPENGIIDKIKKKVTEKKIEESDVKDILKDFETSLMSSDVALEASEKIVNDLKGNLVGKFIKRGEIENVIKNSFRNSILEMLNVDGFDLLERVKTKKPFVIVFLGFNGVGKTTSIARIGHILKKNGLSCVFAAADSWRAAAIEQIEEHGKKLGIEVIKHKYGADPAAVIFDAVKHAKAKEIDVVLADTAGRSHANANLMDELKKIIKVNKPDLKILVLDALTGNDIYDQCKLFNEAVGVDALIITKADAYEKGGAALSASFTIKKPILYLGVGQEYGDLERFDSVKIVEKLLG